MPDGNLARGYWNLLNTKVVIKGGADRVGQEVAGWLGSLVAGGVVAGDSA
jgi:hypothetical protein